MNLNVSGRHLDVTPAISDYLRSKLERITRHFDHVMEVNVILSVEKLAHKAEAEVHVSGKDIFVSVQEQDMYAAIDCLADKLDRQLIRYKEKRTEPRHDAAPIKHRATE